MILQYYYSESVSSSCYKLVPMRFTLIFVMLISAYGLVLLRDLDTYVIISTLLVTC
jgi:hypothetical protein